MKDQFARLKVLTAIIAAGFALGGCDKPADSTALDRLGRVEARLTDAEQANAKLAQTAAELKTKLGELEETSKELRAENAAQAVTLVSIQRQIMKSAEEAKEVEQLTKLTVQVGLSRTPVTNTVVYLMKHSFGSLFPDGIEDFRGQRMNAAFVWASMILPTMADVYSGTESERVILQKLGSEASATSVTDFGGKASFDNVSPGEYYLLCATSLNDGVVLEKRVLVQDKALTVALRHTDQLR